MGIPYFFQYIRKFYPSCLNYIPDGGHVRNKIDHLLLDMNSIIHPCAQRIYKYGDKNKSKKRKRLLPTSSPSNNESKEETEVPPSEEQVFEQVCQHVEMLLRMVQPQKALVMAIDGVAPVGKQQQQRQRRFKGANDPNKKIFDSSCITPGTIFLAQMSQYIQRHFQQRRKEGMFHPNFQVILMDGSVPGEGEHKLMDYIRNHKNKFKDSMCINALDADLIVLALATHIEKIFILRDDIYAPKNKPNSFHLINIGRELRQDLLAVMTPINQRRRCDQCHQFPLDKYANKQHNNYKQKRFCNSCKDWECRVINDFILLCCFVGNDFLPHIPTMNIKTHVMEHILRIYKELGLALTKTQHHHTTIHLQNFQKYLARLSAVESDMLNQQIDIYARSEFPYDLLMGNIDPHDSSKVLFEKFQRDYYRQHFDVDKDNNQRFVKKVVHHYIEGIEWVLNYYLHGVPNWNWKYPHDYSPFIQDLENHILSYQTKRYARTTVYPPLLQLLYVLPPQSFGLIPQPLHQVSQDFPQYYPQEVQVTFDHGCLYEWEGQVHFDNTGSQFLSDVKKAYHQYIQECSEEDQQRNAVGTTIFV
jgi:5'-3' exoribonuclease 1